MPTRSIGERAARAIRDRAKQNGIPVETEALKVYVSRKVICDWEVHNRNPQAYFLQQMALAGYDIYWILTGGKNGENQ